MGLWAPLPRAAGALEMLDRPTPFADRARSLADVARLNGAFGGRLITLGHVKRLLRRVPGDRVATVLDLGTGSADVPRALARWARRVGRPLRVFALDRDEATLRIARRTVGDYPEIVLLRADALELPFRPASVDVVMSALTLHHLEPAAAAAYLRAMDVAARLGFVVNDLLRSRAAWALVWLATRVLARSPMSRHDGPLSVLRAYTAAEIRGLCAEAGIDGVRLHRYAPLMRHCAVQVKP
jgi:SAM-dependent methyltransferase